MNLTVRKILERNERLRAYQMSTELEEIFKIIAKLRGLPVKQIREIFDAQCSLTEFEIKNADGLEYLPEIRWQDFGTFEPNNNKIKRRLTLGKPENHKKEV